MNFLDYLNNKDYIHFCNIKADWKNIVDNSESEVKNHPNCWVSLITDDFESWDDIGNDYNTEMQKFTKWGYNSKNTKSWETTSINPPLTLPWEHEIINQLPVMSATGRPTLQAPGNVMPWHKDNFFYHRRKYPDNLMNIIRFVVFMKDWDIGHVLQSENSIISHWKAGDTIVWHPGKFHLSANIGISSKWTFNITGILKDIDYSTWMK